jgi:hypothetical protein
MIKAVRINLSVAARRAYHTANSQTAATIRMRKPAGRMPALPAVFLRK